MSQNVSTCLNPYEADGNQIAAASPAEGGICCLSRKGMLDSVDVNPKMTKKQEEREALEQVAMHRLFQEQVGDRVDLCVSEDIAQ